MKLSDALVLDRIKLDLTSSEKVQAIEEMIALVQQSVELNDADAVLQRVLAREAVGSTGVDQGVAIPHARANHIDGVVVALGISRPGIDFQSPDDKPAHLVFLILSSQDAAPAYLSVLSRTARIFRQAELCQRVMGATSAKEIIDLIRQWEPM